MKRYELEGFDGDIKETSATTLIVIKDYMHHGDYQKYVVYDTITVRKNGITTKTIEPKVVTLPCINLKEVERAANIIKKLSKVVETSLKSIDPEKQEWRTKTPWDDYKEEHPGCEAPMGTTYIIDEPDPQNETIDGNPPTIVHRSTSEAGADTHLANTEPENKIIIQKNSPPLTVEAKKELEAFLKEAKELLGDPSHKPDAA